MSCPVCSGSLDVRQILLDTLCPEHLLESTEPTDEEILQAIERGMRDAEEIGRSSRSLLPRVVLFAEAG